MTTFSDHPATEDALDRERLVTALHGLMMAPRLQTPLVVGLYGGWGTGKTTVMQMLRARLNEPDQPTGGRPLTLWFEYAGRHPCAP